MAGLLKTDVLYFFVFLVVPGLVAMKAYDLLVAGPRREFGKYAVEMLAIGLFNLTLLKPLFGFVFDATATHDHPWEWNLGLVVALLIAPALEAVAFRFLRDWKYLRGILLQPEQTPWDFVFSKGKHWRIRVALKSGESLAGLYRGDSYASSFPEPAQIYLEELWREKEGEFVERVPGSL